MSTGTAPNAGDWRARLAHMDTTLVAIRAIQANPKLSAEAKVRVMKPLVQASHDDLDAVRAHRDKLQGDRDDASAIIDAMLDIQEAWTKTEHLVIEPNDCSRLHRLLDAIDAGRVRIHGPEHEVDGFPPGELLFGSSDSDSFVIGPKLTLEFLNAKDIQTFVIGHDLAAVMGDPPDGEVQLPFDMCAFEYRISGRSVIVWARQGQDTPPFGIAFYETGSGAWMYLGHADGIFWSQVRAACIMLDAEVAVTRVTRAPHKLNVKRERNGKQPLRDFHVIDLSRRHRAALGAPGVPSGRHYRLHYCRGHWRHYETHKTWIKWCLKGDPTLGFVSKEYRA